jgi:hypothetical protein
MKKRISFYGPSPDLQCEGDLVGEFLGQHDVEAGFVARKFQLSATHQSHAADFGGLAQGLNFS